MGRGRLITEPRATMALVKDAIHGYFVIIPIVAAIPLDHAKQHTHFIPVFLHGCLW